MVAPPGPLMRRRSAILWVCSVYCISSIVNPRAWILHGVDINSPMQQTGR
jgi:hypothetical protein